MSFIMAMSLQHEQPPAAAAFDDGADVAPGIDFDTFAWALVGFPHMAAPSALEPQAAEAALVTSIARPKMATDKVAFMILSPRLRKNFEADSPIDRNCDPLDNNDAVNCHLVVTYSHFFHLKNIYGSAPASTIIPTAIG